MSSWPEWPTFCASLCASLCRAAAAWLNCRSVRAKDCVTWRSGLKQRNEDTHFLIEFVYILIEILNIYFEHPTSDPKWSSKFLCLQCWTPAGGVGGLGYIAGVKLVFRSQKVAKLHAVPDRAFNMSNYGQYCNTLERATLNRSSPENSLDSRRPWIDTG